MGVSNASLWAAAVRACAEGGLPVAAWRFGRYEAAEDGAAVAVDQLDGRGGDLVKGEAVGAGPAPCGVRIPAQPPLGARPSAPASGAWAPAAAVAKTTEHIVAGVLVNQVGSLGGVEQGLGGTRYAQFLVEPLSSGLSPRALSDQSCAESAFSRPVKFDEDPVLGHPWSSSATR